MPYQDICTPWGRGGGVLLRTPIYCPRDTAKSSFHFDVHESTTQGDNPWGAITLPYWFSHKQMQVKYSRKDSLNTKVLSILSIVNADIFILDVSCLKKIYIYFKKPDRLAITPVCTQPHRNFYFTSIKAGCQHLLGLLPRQIRIYMGPFN